MRLTSLSTIREKPLYKYTRMRSILNPCLFPLCDVALSSCASRIRWRRGLTENSHHRRMLYIYIIYSWMGTLTDPPTFANVITRPRLRREHWEHKVVLASNIQLWWYMYSIRYGAGRTNGRVHNAVSVHYTVRVHDSHRIYRRGLYQSRDTWPKYIDDSIDSTRLDSLSLSFALCVLSSGVPTGVSVVQLAIHCSCSVRSASLFPHIANTPCVYVESLLLDKGSSTHWIIPFAAPFPSVLLLVFIREIIFTEALVPRWNRKKI